MVSTFIDRHLAEYRSEGFAVLPEYFAADEIERMQAAAGELLNLAINSSLALGETNPRLDIMHSRGRQVVRKIQAVNDASQCFAEISSDPRVLEPIRAILKADPVLMDRET